MAEMFNITGRQVTANDVISYDGWSIQIALP